MPPKSRGVEKDDGSEECEKICLMREELSAVVPRGLQNGLCREKRQDAEEDLKGSRTRG